MPNKHELEMILHKEKMKEWNSREKVKGQREEFNEFIDENIPFSEDLKYNSTLYKNSITEYKEKYIQPLGELALLDFKKAQLIRLRRSILLCAMYICIYVMLAMSIYIWA